MLGAKTNVGLIAFKLVECLTKVFVLRCRATITIKNINNLIGSETCSMKIY
jgi:hypothetical protein